VFRLLLLGSTFEEKDSSEVMGEFDFLDALVTEDGGLIPDNISKALTESYLACSILSTASVLLEFCFWFLGVMSSNGSYWEEVFLVIVKSLVAFCSCSLELYWKFSLAYGFFEIGLTLEGRLSKEISSSSLLIEILWGDISSSLWFLCSVFELALMIFS